MSADLRGRWRALLLLAGLPVALGACDRVGNFAMAVRDDIFSDFKQQPRIEPWKAEYRGDTLGFPGNPQLSMPTHGSIAPGMLISYQPTLGALDSLGQIANPVEPSAESLERGRRHYQINCAVCHGATGGGGGPVMAYGLPVPSLLTPAARGYSDGYIFGILRNGRGLMPNYRRIPEEQRWDVVNYMRGLQGMLPVAVSTEPAGFPGEGGAAVPGASVVAPTRPVPHFQPPRQTPDQDMPAPAPAAPAAPTAPGGQP